FGNAGTVILQDYTQAGDFAIQDDGKILVVGNSGPLKLWRFNSDGSPDDSFTPAGTSIYSQASDMAIMPDGKIVVAAESKILRFNPDGNLDTGFGNNGTVTATLAITSMEVDHLSDKIIVGGYVQTSTFVRSIVIARYNYDGTADLTFNGTGIKIFDQPQPSSAFVTDLKIDSSHRISASGYYSFQAMYFPSYASNHWLCRLNDNGAMDTTFSDDGILIVDPGSFNSFKANQSNAMVAKEDGSLIVAGSKGTDPYTQRDFALYEVSSAGILQNPNMPFSYGFTVNKNDLASSLAVDNNGRYVLAGKTGNGVFQNSFALVRLNPDYTVDTSFGINGTVTTFPQTNNNTIKKIAIQPDNKIVALGTITMGDNSSFPNRLCIARYLETSSLSVTDSPDNRQVQLYPNPVKNILYAKIPDGSPLNDFYSISDVQGRIVQTGLIASANFEINVDSLKNGLYIFITPFLKPTKFVKD
ncbi:MAG: T9SS type A sorting domain-containing protein, partial [Flavobacterium sp.]